MTLPPEIKLITPDAMPPSQMFVISADERKPNETWLEHMERMAREGRIACIKNLGTEPPK